MGGVFAVPIVILLHPVPVIAISGEMPGKRSVNADTERGEKQDVLPPAYDATALPGRLVESYPTLAPTPVGKVKKAQKEIGSGRAVECLYAGGRVFNS